MEIGVTTPLTALLHTCTPGARLTKEMKGFFSESVKALTRSIKELSRWQKDPSRTTPFEHMLPVTRDLSTGPGS